MQDFISIINKTKSRVPALPFVLLKNQILGKKYELSIAYVSPSTSKNLNNKWREKNKPTNILSFTLSKNSGELVLCPLVIKKETKKFERNFSDLLLFLVIHGMLHLKGMEHSSRMEVAEKKYLDKYDKKHFHRNRRGHIHDQSSRGRIH